MIVVDLVAVLMPLNRRQTRSCTTQPLWQPLLTSIVVYWFGLSLLLRCVSFVPWCDRQETPLPMSAILDN